MDEYNLRMFTTGIRTSVLTGEDCEVMVGKTARGPLPTQLMVRSSFDSGII